MENKVKINVNEFYGKPSYYSVMPEEIFNALELAALKGEKTVEVDKGQFDRMIIDYNDKMLNIK